MAKPGRRPNRIPTIRWDVFIPVDLASSIELLLRDPAREKVKHGARSGLIEELLRNWLNERVAGRTVAVSPSLDQIELLLQHRVEGVRIRHDGLVDMPREWAKRLGLWLE